MVRVWRTDEGIEAEAKRRELEAKAREVLGPDVQVEGVSDIELMKRVLAKFLPVRLPLDGKPDAYVEGAYYALTGPDPSRGDAADEHLDAPRAAEKFKKDTEQAWKTTPVGASREAAAIATPVHADGEQHQDAQALREKFMRETEQAWRNPSVGASRELAK